VTDELLRVADAAAPHDAGAATPDDGAVTPDDGAGRPPDTDGADPGAPAAAPDAERAGEPEPPPGEGAGTDDTETGTDDAAVTPTPSGPRSVGRLIADGLRAAGVRYAFTVPGESFLGLLDVLGDAGIRVIATRHEGAASFMAEAHGQLTGRPAACLATRAVGSANLGIGIHTAHQDSTPMFALVGQVERRARGREGFQEIDQVHTIGGLAKWAAEIDDPADAAATMSEAIQQALGGRPGPVLLSLPEDVLDLSAPDDAHIEAGRPPAPRASDDDVRAVIELLASARRPVILAGGGILRARTSTELLRFAELLQVPIVAAWRRPDVIANDHPLYLGMSGLGTAPCVRDRLAGADAMLVIGSRLNEPTSDGWSLPAATTRWAHVDLELRRAGDQPAADISVLADARSFLRAANERLLGRAVLDAELVRVRQANNAADRATWEASTVVDAGDWDGPGVHPGRIVTTLQRVLPEDAILTTDAGNFAGWAGRGFRSRKPGTFIGPTSGAMGYGLPAAIAASLVHRDRPVVALVGDGGLAMTMAEIETSVREHARVIVVIFDNERYGTIRMWQERRGTGQGVATELGPVDFAAIGRAMGARGVRVEADAEFETALRQALVESRTTVIQLSVDRRWVSVDEPATSGGG
jgi:acetolactate synthase-1/2/3 large subunit